MATKMSVLTTCGVITDIPLDATPEEVEMAKDLTPEEAAIAFLSETDFSSMHTLRVKQHIFRVEKIERISFF